VHVLLTGTAAEQIDVLPAQLSGARAGENELRAGFAFDQEMDHLEQRRELLDLIDDDMSYLRVRLRPMRRCGLTPRARLRITPAE
jgi:hypothetical protein